MAKAAWEAVSAETIRHCWDHTKIQLYILTTVDNDLLLRAHRSTRVGWTSLPVSNLTEERE